jgi:glutaredoxin
MKKLTIYTKHDCGFCVMLKTLLERKQIDYEEININQDENAREFLKQAGHRTVPQIYCEGELFVEGGFNGMKKYLAEQEQLTHSLGTI